MFVKCGHQLINLALVARVEVKFLDGKLNGATAFFQNGTFVGLQRDDAEDLLEATEPPRVMAAEFKPTPTITPEEVKEIVRKEVAEAIKALPVPAPAPPTPATPKEQLPNAKPK